MDSAGEPGGIFSKTEQGGDGGRIEISGRNLLIADNAVISASSTGDGAAGRVEIRVDNFRIASGAEITINSDGAGRAGSITIDAIRKFAAIQGKLIIRTTASDGGDIIICVNEIMVMIDSELTTSVAGTGGNIVIKVPFFLANGGNVVQPLPAFSTEGSVTVETGEDEAVSDPVVLSTALLTSAQQFTEACRRRGYRTPSSFVATGRGALPVGPDRPMFSQLAAIEPDGPRLVEAAKTAAVAPLAADLEKFAELNTARPPTFALIKLYCGA